MGDVDFHGPIFNGTADPIIRAYCNDAEKAVADEGVTMVRQYLHGVLRHPTGYYASHIQTDRLAGDQVINDGNVVYGPWLEGTSRRNHTTRFRGYRTFRLTTQRLKARAVGIAERRLPMYLERLS